MIASSISERFPDTVASVELPVVYGKAREELLRILEKMEPEVIISFGLNGKIGHIAVEEIALNIRSSEIADNEGRKVTGEPISPNGTLAYRTTLPVDRIVETLKGKGIPVKRSYSAGVFICNEVFYTLMEWCALSGARGGFIHVPMASEMIAQDHEMSTMPHMATDMLIDAGRTITSVVLGEDPEIR